MFSFLTLETVAQKCDRPEEVFIRLNSIDSAIVFNCFRKRETRIYLQDSSEVFVRTSQLNEISESRYAQIDFHSIRQLRKKEIDIRKCEADKADGTIYLDININSIFKNIYMVIHDEEKIYSFQVHWIDGIE